MSVLEAIILGIVQGLTEFLPISSSGHLQIITWLAGWEPFGGDPGLWTAFEVALHAGTLVGVLAYFGAEVVRLGAAGLRRLAGRRSPEGRQAWLLVGATVPAAVVGALAGDVLERNDRVWVTACTLAAFGVLLWWADRRGGTGRQAGTDTPASGGIGRSDGSDMLASGGTGRSDGSDMLASGGIGRSDGSDMLASGGTGRSDGSDTLASGADALALGVAQALALVPGVSRSGAIMTAARLRGLSRPAAARVAMLMSVPIIAGAAIYKLIQMGGWSGIPADARAAFGWGVLAAAISGWAAVRLLLALVRRVDFAAFAWYRVALGISVLILVATSFRNTTWL